MISDTPIVEFLIVKDLDESYRTQVTGINGRIDWNLFEEFRSLFESDPCISHPDIKPIINEYEHERDGAILMTAELYEVETEVQYGTSEEINILPGYYDIKNCKFVLFERLTMD